MSAQSGQTGVSGHTPAALAARQRDLVTIEQLRATGLPRATIYDRVARGVLRRVHRGVYTTSHAPLSPEAKALAAVPACGEGAALRRLSAARLYGCSRFPAPLIEVVSPRRRKVSGARVRHCRSLDPRDVTDFDGIPVTTAHRMFVDLAEALTPHQLANVIHEAAYRRRFDLQETRAAIERANGRRNLKRLEAAIAIHLTGSSGTKSRAERIFRRLVEPEEPLSNVTVEGIEVDFFFPERRLVVEIDDPSHGRPRSTREDALERRVLEAAGYTLLRFTNHEVQTRPIQVLSRLRAGR